MFYYITSATYQKIGDLFSSGLSHSVLGLVHTLVKRYVLHYSHFKKSHLKWSIIQYFLTLKSSPFWKNTLQAQAIEKKSMVLR